MVMECATTGLKEAMSQFPPPSTSYSGRQRTIHGIEREVVLKHILHAMAAVHGKRHGAQGCEAFEYHDRRILAEGLLKRLWHG